MATSLYGYGPHLITTNDDFDLKCVASQDGKPTLLTINVEYGTGPAYDGTVTVKSRGQRGAGVYGAQAYTTQLGVVASAALAATQVVQLDASQKDVRLTCAARTTGTLTLTLGLDTDH